MRRPLRDAVLSALSALCLAGCASKPLLPYTTASPPLMLVPAIQRDQ